MDMKATLKRLKGANPLDAIRKLNVGKPISPDRVETASLSLPAAGLNELLKKTDKDYVLFVDDGAEYAESYITDLLSVFSSDPKLGVVSGLVLTPSGKPLAHETNTDSAKIIRQNASSKFSEALLIPYGAIYRMDIIRKNRLGFAEDLEYCRDELFAIQYMEASPRSARFNGATYRTAKILDETNTKTPQSFSKAWYFDSAGTLLDKLTRNGANRGISQIAQYGLLYLTIQRFKSNQGGLIKLALDGEVETEEYLSQVGAVMRAIDNEVLFCRASAVKWERYKKIFFAQLRDPAIPLEFEVRKSAGNLKLQAASAADGGKDAFLFLKGDSSNTCVCRIGEQHASVMSLEYTANEEGAMGLDIFFRLARCFPVDSYRFGFSIDCSGKTREVPAIWETPIAGIVTFFDHYACRRDVYHAFIPLEGASPCTISLHADFDGFRVEKDIEFSKSLWANKLTTNDEWGYWYFDGHIAQSADGKIVVRPATEKDRESAEMRYQAHLLERYEAAEAKAEGKPKTSKAMKDRNTAKRVYDLRKRYWETRGEFAGRTIWIYGDKSFKAGDNAEYAFRYAAAQEDGIEKAFYINPKSSDADRLKNAGYRVMSASSLEGELYALHASIVHMTHVPAFQKFGFGPERIGYFRDLMDAKVVRVYHGYPITRSASYAQIAEHCARVVIGTEYERELYTNADNGYLPSQVLATGMPRYDDLKDDRRRQILFAPTWRPALASTGAGGAFGYNPAFKESLYFHRYEAIMNDERLLAAARRTGYKIKMFLHPKHSAQTVDFESNDIVEALSCTEDIDYVTIMSQSDLMVTDYSSVQFDFAFLRKPVLYFHDPALPYWRLVDFDYAKYGFGEICTDADQMVNTLIDYMERDCQLDAFYRERIDSFFVNDDQLASKRLYEADLELQREEKRALPLRPADPSLAQGL